MTFEELDAKLDQATERVNLGYFDEAEQLVNDVLSHLPQSAETASNSAITEIPGLEESSAPDRAAMIRARATLESANICYRRGDTDASLALCEDVRRFADSWNLLPLQRTTWNLLGQVHNYRGSHDIARSFLERVIAEGQDANEDMLTARATGNLAGVYSGLLNYPRAFEYHRKALAAFEIHGDRRMIGGTKVNMGTIYITLNRYEEALDCLNSALSIFEDLGERPFRLTAMNRIGIIYLKLQKYDLALEHYLKLLAAYEELGSKSGVASTLTNIGVVHFLRDNHPLALEYHSRALAMNEEIGTQGGIANAFGNVGQVYHKLLEYNQALDYLTKALSLYEELDQRDGVANSLAHIGNIYADPSFEGRDVSKAEECLLQSLAIQTESGQTTHLAQKHKYLSELYEQEHRDAEALVHYKKYHVCQKEVLNKEAIETAEKYRQGREMAEREKEVALVKARADAEITITTTLLHKVLPASVAYRLIKGEKVADYFQAVSILFADIVGFTPIAAKMPARKVLAFLNHVFGEFDRIIEKHGCEKIKTIGDGYMAVAGAPIECSDHAERIARAAMEMMRDIQLPEDIRASLPKGSKFNIRIGINSGPAFGGIVGENRFVYDIYSDAVNMAARMESHGEAGRIHVSEDFAFHLQNRMDTNGDDVGGIVFEERDEIEIKGKGMMKTYFVNQRPSTV